MTTSDLRSWAGQALGHEFRDLSLLEQALTHGSSAPSPLESYERLEFLGDRILGLVVAEALFFRGNETEGDMNRRLSTLVDKASCAAVAKAIGADRQVRLETSARQLGIHRSENLLGDVCESLIGALYLDGGLKAAKNFILGAWEKRLSDEAAPPRNPKNSLQEWAQGRGLPIPSYNVTRRDGPPHAPRFTVRVDVRGLEAAEAEGSSKQEAEKAAATLLLEREKIQ